MRAAMWALGLSLVILAACSGNGTGPGPQPVQPMATDRDEVAKEVASLPLKHVEWDLKLTNRTVTRVTLGTDHLFVETHDNHLIAVDRHSGMVTWEWINPHDTPLDWAPIEAHGVADEINTLEAELARVQREVEDEGVKKPELMDFKKLEQLKKKRTELREQVKAARDSDNVYMVARHVLYCLERPTGKELWWTKLLFAPSAQPFATRGYVFVPSADRARVRLLSVDKRGQELDSFRSSLEKVNDIHNRAIYEHPILYFPSHDGNVYAWFVEKLQPQWSFQTGGQLKADPYIFRYRAVERYRDERSKEVKTREREYKLLVIGGMDRAVYCLDADSGKLLWKNNVPGEVMSSAVGKDATIYVRSDLAHTGEVAYLHAFEALPTHAYWVCEQHVDEVSQESLKCPKCAKDRTRIPTGPFSLGKRRWQLPKAERFLQKFKNYVLILGPNQKLISVDEMSGKILGEYQTYYLKFFLTNTRDDVFYCATPDGHIFALKESKERF